VGTVLDSKHMILILLKLILFPLLSPLCIGIVRKIKAYMQNRQGASVLQPYFDLWKLFHKDEVVAGDASWIFMVTPYFIFALSIILPLSIPFISHAEALGTVGDFLVVIYVLALLTFFLALAGMDTGSAFGGFGSSREMTLSALTEGNVLFSILPISLVTHSTNLVMMATTTASLPVTNYAPIGIAFLGFFIAMMSETGRIPFDNPSTHLELTMIHEAMILEYSGKRLALIEWTNANKFLFFTVLGMNLFFPWGFDNASLLVTLGITLVKILLLITIFAIIELSIAKFRLFRLPDLLLTGFIFCVIALVAIIV